MPTTTNYGWAYPTTGSDSGNWGEILNDALVDADADLKAVSDVATAALPKAGGVTTGRVDVHSATMKVVALGNINGAVALDATTGQYFTGALTGSVTFTVTTPPAAGLAFGIVLKLTNSLAGVVWPAGTKWSGATPTGTLNTDTYVLFTDDGGSTWHGVIVARGHS